MNIKISIAIVIAIVIIGASLLFIRGVELNEGLETSLASVVAFAIWGAALVGAYKILERWWRTKPGQQLLKLLKRLPLQDEASIKGVAIIALIIAALYLLAVIIGFLHDELGFF